MTQDCANYRSTTFYNQWSWLRGCKGLGVAGAATSKIQLNLHATWHTDHIKSCLVRAESAGQRMSTCFLPGINDAGAFRHTTVTMCLAGQEPWIRRARLKKRSRTVQMWSIRNVYDNSRIATYSSLPTIATPSLHIYFGATYASKRGSQQSAATPLWHPFPIHEGQTE